MIVAAFSPSQAGIRQMAYLDPGQGQQVARGINNHARALCTEANKAIIYRYPEHLRIPVNEEANHHVTKALEDQGYKACKQRYTMAANRAR